MTERTPDATTNAPVSSETLLKVTKEIVIKFIEVGRLTPSTFEQNFGNIYQTIKDTVNKS